jgi:hypothetical protein
LGRVKGRDHLRYRHGWEDHIKVDRKEVGWKDVDWMNVAYDGDWWPTPPIITMNL